MTLISLSGVNISFSLIKYRVIRIINSNKSYGGVMLKLRC